MGCVLGARTPHEFLRIIIVLLDSSEGHQIRNWKTGPGWISYSRMGALYTNFSITTAEIVTFAVKSQACLSYWSLLLVLIYSTINMYVDYQ